MSEETNNKTTPPYLPYRTFLSSLQNLSEGIPPRIDRGIWKNQTGTIQSLIIGAYRFFELIDDGNKPTKKLQDLVAHRDKPNDQVKALLEERYADIIKHSLATMTVELIDDYFEDVFHVQGDTKRKSITFFLQAAKAVGMPLSKFLQSQVRVRTSGSRRVRRREEDELDEEDRNGDEEPSSGKAVRTVALRETGGTLTLSGTFNPFDLDGDERKLVYDIIDLMKTYEQKTGKASD